MSIKNSSDTIVNRTRDLPACSAVTQSTAPPRAPNSVDYTLNILVYKLKVLHRHLPRNFLPKAALCMLQYVFNSVQNIINIAKGYVYVHTAPIE
jgi:hypothetical protein